jgi:hypothetical protein
MDKKSVHQSLMDEGYDLWDKNSDFLCYEEFLDLAQEKLGFLYREAVITGNLNYQVGNGGFHQWNANEYSVCIDELINFFQQNFDKENKIIISVLHILEEVSETINWVEDGKKEIKKVDYDYREFFNERLDDYLYDNLGRSDESYYKINEELMEILEEFFSNKLNEKNGESNKSTLSETSSSN